MEEKEFSLEECRKRIYKMHIKMACIYLVVAFVFIYELFCVIAYARSNMEMIRNFHDPVYNAVAILCIMDIYENIARHRRHVREARKSYNLTFEDIEKG